MLIFRYHMAGGRSFDELSPVQDQPIDVIRDHLARSLCPPVQKPRDAWLTPVFHVTDVNGVAHVVNTANWVETEILEVEDPTPDPAAARIAEGYETDYAAYRERMVQAPWDTRETRHRQADPEPGPHLRLAASNGDQVSRRSHGGPFGGHEFN